MICSVSRTHQTRWHPSIRTRRGPSCQSTTHRRVLAPPARPHLPSARPPAPIRDNPELTALSGLAGFTGVGSLVLEDNPKLTALPDLATLTEIAGKP